jgi:hypothetical protein
MPAWLKRDFLGGRTALVIALAAAAAALAVARTASWPWA